MSRIAVPLVATAAALFITAAVSPSPAHAASESLSCQTINGRTVCVHGSGANSTSSLSCRTVNGNTVCNGSGGRHCATIDGRLTCTSGGDRSKPHIVSPSARAGALPPSLMPDLDDEDDESGL
jgi:hypothetical protein